MKNPKIDLHMHTTVSDGTDTPGQLLEKVKAAGISLFSVTDHDAVKAGKIISGLIKDGDPRFIPGVEFSCRDGDGKYHILGYGYKPEDQAILSIVSRGHEQRLKKVIARLDFLKNRFGFCFSKEDTDELLSLDNPGKPHIGNLMVKYGFAETKERAIKDYIDLISFEDGYVSPKEAISGILGSGGIPVLAHPFYGSGDELILGDEMEKRLKKLMDLGLKGVEAFYSGFTEKLCRDMLGLAKKHGLYVTAGSDYHGDNKITSIGDTGLDVSKEYPQELTRFLRALEV